MVQAGKHDGDSSDESGEKHRKPDLPPDKHNGIGPMKHRTLEPITAQTIQELTRLQEGVPSNNLNRLAHPRRR